MQVRALKTRIFREGEDLERFITTHIRRLPERSVLVVTSKIVALAEGRTVPGGGNDRIRTRLIKQESDVAIRTKYTWLTVKDGAVLASAGIDESNANGKFILLPKDSYATAARLRMSLKRRYKIKKLGVLITDSRLLPLRSGAVGIALGYAGFKGKRDYRGAKDMFGRVFHVSQTDVADSLATAAVLEMGEGKERRPLAVITEARVDFCERVSRRELAIDWRDDVYAPLFRAVRPKRKK